MFASRVPLGTNRILVPKSLAIAPIPVRFVRWPEAPRTRNGPLIRTICRETAHLARIAPRRSGVRVPLAPLAESLVLATFMRGRGGFGSGGFGKRTRFQPVSSQNPLASAAIDGARPASNRRRWTPRGGPDRLVGRARAGRSRRRRRAPRRPSARQRHGPTWIV